jgi:hypothetical protein
MKKKNRTKKFKPNWTEIRERPEMKTLAKNLLKMGWVLK